MKARFNFKSVVLSTQLLQSCPPPLRGDLLFSSLLLTLPPITFSLPLVHPATLWLREGVRKRKRKRASQTLWRDRPAVQLDCGSKQGSQTSLHHTSNPPTNPPTFLIPYTYSSKENPIANLQCSKHHGRFEWSSAQSTPTPTSTTKIAKIPTATATSNTTRIAT